MPTGDELRQAILLLRDYEESGAGWFWSSDAAGSITYLSDCIATCLGHPRADIIGTPVLSLFRTEQAKDQAGERPLRLILNGRKTFLDLAMQAAVDGQVVWWSISGRPQFDAAGEFIGYRGNGTDITATHQDQQDASRLARYDSLTGLTNRYHLDSRLTATLSAYRAAKRSCAVMIIDLDRFKQVNDTLGHPAGDDLLKQVAQRLQRTLDKSFEIGRLGGDEFQIILPDIDDRGRLGEIANRIILAVSQPYLVDGSRCIIGASVGIAIAPYDGVNSDDLVRNADLALYAAKGGGRGQFRFYSSDLHREAERRRRIEGDLRDALQLDQISLAYQPIVDPRSNKVVTLEALMRWNHPELGPISPSIFVPIAEDSNLIAALGDWALRRACEEIVQLDGQFRIAVNVSPAQFSNPAFPVVVAQAIANSGIKPDRLELELTESIFLADGAATDEMFAALKNLGVRLVLDDFGTGYSSLAYLRKAPFDKIKIDQGFIRGVTEPGNRNGAIITAIVSLAEALDMDTTAEGIEALDELEMMRKLGVGQIQGFIYSSGVSFDEVSEAMNNGDWIIEPSGPGKYRTERRTVFRKIGVIHEDHRYEVMMRNYSSNGAMIEGLMDVPKGTEFVVDFGEGQLAVARVRRSTASTQGIEFETPLVDDGAGGLCTRHRISPYILASAGMPVVALTPGMQLPTQLGGASGFSLPKFGQVIPKLKPDRAA